MSGVLGTIAAAAGAASGGGTAGLDVTPDAINWTDANGANVGATNKQTISGINAPVSLLLTRTGLGFFQYIQNGALPVPIASGGVVVVNNGDTLAWTVSPSSGSNSGVATITNQSDGGAAIDTFNYDVVAFNYPF